MSFFDTTPLGRLMNRFSCVRHSFLTTYPGETDFFRASPLAARIPTRSTTASTTRSGCAWRPSRRVRPLFRARLTSSLTQKAAVGASIIVIAIVYPYFLIPTAFVLALFVMTSNFCECSFCCLRPS